MKTLNHEITFVPGYYGSHLYKEGKRVFLNISQILPIQPVPRFEERSQLEPQLLEFAGWGPFRQKVYAKAMGAYKNMGWTPSSFAYDWRDDLQKSAQLFLQKISERKNPQWIVAHSMGGLVVLSAIIEAQKNKPELLNKIRGVAFIAAPFKGLPVLFRNFLIGTPFYYNPYFLKPNAIENHWSSYQMLPEFVKLKTPDGISRLDTTDFNQWAPHLEQFQSPVKESSLFKNRIQRAADFRGHLEEAGNMSFPFPLLVVQTTGLKTPSHYEILAEGQLQLDHVFWGPFMRPRKGFLNSDGDQTVTQDSQHLPGKLHGKAQVIKLKTKGHLAVLSEPQTLRALNLWIQAESSPLVATNEPDHKEGLYQPQQP